MQIIDYVWKDSEEIPYDRVIDVYIKELRKKLKLDLGIWSFWNVHCTPKVLEPIGPCKALIKSERNNIVV